MKRKNITKGLSLLLMMTLFSAGIISMPAEAGLSNIVLDRSTYEEEFDSSVWNNPDGDIVIKDGVLVFENDSTEDTRLITKTSVQGNKEIDELVNIQTKMKFTSLPEGEKFVIALGVRAIEARQGDSGNVEITFTNNGGVTVSLIYYDEDGEAQTLKEATRCGSLNTQMAVEAVVTTEGVLTVKAGGKTLWTVELPVNGEGRIGFLQTGSCGVALSETKVVSHLYDSPENCDIYEDFETGGFNANLLSSKMQGASYVCWPSGTGVEDYNGSQVFRYTNSGECYVATKYAYSNFEISFDVPYMQRQSVMTEEGEMVIAGSNRFGVSYGGNDVDFDYAGYTDAVSDVVWFNKNSTITSDRAKVSVDAAALGFPFFATDCDKGFSIKITMQDSITTVYMKWLEEDNYTEVAKYQLSTTTPNGYLHIWTNGPTNMAIDNLRVVNTDVEPQLVDVEFKTSVIEGPGHYEYQPMEKVYASVNEESGFNWYLVILAAACVCAVSFGAVVGVSAIKKHKRKVGDNSEV